MHSRIPCLYCQHVVVSTSVTIVTQCDYELTRTLIRSLRLYAAQGISNLLCIHVHVFPLFHTSFDAVDVLHIKLVLFVFTFIQQKQNENQKFSWNTLCRIHYPLHMFLNSVEYSFFSIGLSPYVRKHISYYMWK